MASLEILIDDSDISSGIVCISPEAPFDASEAGLCSRESVRNAPYRRLPEHRALVASIDYTRRGSQYFHISFVVRAKYFLVNVPNAQ
ncbi:hypothetical protein M513_08854 [Trichuris suis]|uniref:Uncharacterized protein n=1 Tax=Trichuris suis TaxID=68888 RepID=A0A085LZ30_9BILA|nr:hypothetical protein M513_08854 [Trichuris suis]